ncbi:flagellin A [Helicobacter felis]|uniref:Flagellin A n=1 Tax=Helicobacter felis (strain ATCC 49179 / CCUG 28539 / NCTC 12436 / CS1) TaxID=936155 RepID=FLAA_HELFC|nr:flagellin A [Helicobacter felis]Q9XB38.3 RecName: Full=Flagellin A [Helicobacter felis ATCC 49179]CAB46858.1 flagellin A [Helicobacter felis ATCC 49179]CBY82490.1 putative flagellin, FlaA [Helicobacter felis ATCC 49179]
MAFQVNTNINALNAHAMGLVTQRELKESLERLSSGLRINKAADDASGMTIADSLRSQAKSLGQAIANTNDGMGIIQIADKAMDEQIKILDTIKVKATQAAQDGQNTQSRKALQADIVRLIQSLDNIGNTTSYNGQTLLSGAFSNKEFQVGAYSNETIKASIGSATSDKIGQVKITTGKNITASGEVALTFKQVDGVHDVSLESVKISTSAGTGLGVLAEVINKNSNATGVRATANVITTSDSAIKSGSLSSLTVNGIEIGNILGIKKNDSDGRLVAALNAVTAQTGVEAYTDSVGRLNLRSIDGRGINIKANSTNVDGQASALTTLNGGQDITRGSTNFGRLSLVRQDARDILVVSGANVSASAGYAAIGFAKGTTANTTVNLRDVLGEFNQAVRSASGANYNKTLASENLTLGSGVTTLRGAMVVMDIAESAQKMLDKVRSDLGSVQNQMVSTVNNITITQVNVKAAESQIRDVDFAQESANFSKNNILAQSGSYAMSQANTVQQNILRLLT